MQVCLLVAGPDPLAKRVSHGWRSWKRPLADAATEGVPSGVKKYPERLARLVDGPGSAELQHCRFRGVKVIDRQVEVQLLGHVLRRPHRRPIVLHPLEAQTLPIFSPYLSSVRFDADLPIQQAAVEPGQHYRVRAIQDDTREARDGHGQTLASRSQPEQTPAQIPEDRGRTSVPSAPMPRPQNTAVRPGLGPTGFGQTPIGALRS